LTLVVVAVNYKVSGLKISLSRRPTSKLELARKSLTFTGVLSEVLVKKLESSSFERLTARYLLKSYCRNVSLSLATSNATLTIFNVSLERFPAA